MTLFILRGYLSLSRFLVELTVQDKESRSPIEGRVRRPITATE
jgi:hypothetical protein